MYRSRLLAIICTLSLGACGAPVSQSEASAIAIERFCEFLGERYPEYDCRTVAPNLSDQGHGKRLYEFSVRDSPEITVIVIVHSNGRSEVSLWDELVKRAVEEEYGEKN